MGWEVDPNDNNHIQIVLGHGDVGVALANYKDNPTIAGVVFVPLDQAHKPGTDLSKERFLTPANPKISIRVDNLDGLASFKRFYEFLQQKLFGTEITNGMNMVSYLMEENGELKDRIMALEQANEALRLQLMKGQPQ